MRRMSHYLGFYTEILSTKVGIKRSELIELITIVQLYDHPSRGVRQVRDWQCQTGGEEVLNIAGAGRLECFYNKPDWAH